MNSMVYFMFIILRNFEVKIGFKIIFLILIYYEIDICIFKN